MKQQLFNMFKEKQRVLKVETGEFRISWGELDLLVKISCNTYPVYKRSIQGMHPEDPEEESNAVCSHLWSGHITAISYKQNWNASKRIHG